VKNGGSTPSMTPWQARAWRKVSWAPLCDPNRILIARRKLRALENKFRGMGRVILGGMTVVWLAWISLPYLGLGRLAFISNIDAADSVYPQIAPIVEMLKHGWLSLWNPSLAAGTDTLGNFNSPIFGVLAFVALPPWLASYLVIMSVHMLALVGMYLLCTALGVWPILAAFGAFLYSQELFWGYNQYVFGAGLILGGAPLMAAWLLRVRRLSWKTAGVSVALGLMMALGGHYSWSLFEYVAIAALVFVFAERRFDIWIAHLAIIGAVIFVVQLPFFLANLTTAPFSSRIFGGAYYEYGSVRLDWSLFFPTGRSDTAYLYTTYWLILTFALITFYLPARALIAALFYSGSYALDLALPYTLGWLSVAGYQVYPDGSLGGPYAFRFFLILPLIAILALVLAIDHPWRLLRGSAKNSFAGPPLPIVVLCVTLTIQPILSIGYNSANTDHAQAYDRAIISYQAAKEGLNFFTDYEQPALIQLAQARPDHHTYRVATVAFNGPIPPYHPPYRWEKAPTPSLYGPFQNAYGFETADGYASNLVGRYERYWHRMLLGRDMVPSQFYPTFMKDYSTRFTNPGWAFQQKLYLFEPIGSQRSNEFGCMEIPMGWRFSDVYDLGMLSLANVEYVVSAFPLDEPRFTLLPSSVRQRQEELVCANTETKVRALQEENVPPLPIYVYRNEDAGSRVFAPSHVEVFESENAELEAMRGRGVTALRQTAVINTKDIEGGKIILPAAQSIKVVNVTMEDDRATVAIETATGGLLVVANAYTPFWKADVDGSPAPIIPAYYAFQGIVVPPGSKVVKLHYCPSYVPFGCQ